MEGSCKRCGVVRWLHRHHIVPRSEGGSNDPSNIESICANCHEDAHGGPVGGKLRGGLGNSPASLAKKAETMRRRWADPEMRAKYVEARYRGWDGRRKPRPEREELRAAYHDEGLSQVALGVRYEVSQVRISQWMQELGITARPGGRRHNISPPADLVTLYAEHTTEEIGERFGVSGGTVRNWLIAAGIERRPHGVGPHDEAKRPSADALAALAAQHESVTAAAEALGVPPTTLTAWLKRAGIELSWVSNKPSREEYEAAYLAANFDLALLAERYGVSYPTALRWAHDYGIELRAKRGRPPAA